MRKHIFVIIVIVFFLGYILFQYYNREEEKFLTCSNNNFNQTSLNNQLLIIAELLEQCKKQKKQIILPKWNHNTLFDDRITQIFLEEIPTKNTKKMIHQQNYHIDKLIVSELRHLFTYNYVLVLYILRQLPILCNGKCIALDLTNICDPLFIQNSIDNFRIIFPDTMIFVFGVKRIPDFLSTYQNIIISPLVTDEENFIAFSICTFKILTSDSFYMAAWIDNRYNSKVIHCNITKQIPLHWRKEETNLSNFGGILVYNGQYNRFLSLCESFRRVYPHSNLKILVRPGEQVVQPDIEFFHGQLTYVYKDFNEFLELISSFTEEKFTFLRTNEQFNFPIDWRLYDYSHKNIFDTSDWQAHKFQFRTTQQLEELNQIVLSFLDG